LLTALTGKAETNLMPFDGDVAVFERGQAVAVVLLCVFIVPDTDERRLQKMDNGRQYLFARQSAQGHMLPHFLPDAGQSKGEADNTLILRAFPHLAKTRVIPVLLAPPCIPSGRLNMAVGEGAYPDVRPSGRNGKRFNPLQHILFAEPGAVRGGIGESRPDLLAAYARSGVGDVSQTRRLSGVLWIDNRLNAIGRFE